MKVDILQEPETAIAYVVLEAEEDILTQVGSVMAMKGNFKTNTMTRRGPESAESNKKPNSSRPVFLHSLKADAEGGELYLASSLVGAIGVYQMSKYKLIIRLSSYLASSGKVEVFFGFQDFKFQSKGKSKPSVRLKNTWLNLVGEGTVLLAALGNMYPLILEGDQDQMVNLDNIVAFENSLKVRILPQTKHWWQFWLPNQETLCLFQGQGTVICQTHRPRPFVRQISQTLLGKKLEPKAFQLYSSPLESE